MALGRIEGQVAIITGGSRGQGAVEARLFAAEGASVAICDVLESEGEAVAEEITSSGGNARFFRLDVANEHEWEAVVAKIVAWAGKITVPVNNAGIINQLGVRDTSIARWHRVMDVNITGPFLGMKHVAPQMERAGGGSIINIASIASHVGVKCAAYVSSKTALVGLTRTAALEFAEFGIRVNAVCPGTVVTDLVATAPHFEAMRLASPMKRHGLISEIAQLVLFLASTESSFVTGTDIKIDGGFLAAGGMKLVHRLTAKSEALASLKS
jgi:3alpha(or 20beta)-hydroxysteroid dehydrogenase